MEFGNVGAHCAYKYCRRQTFLPVKCPECGLQFCEEHIKPKDHECPRSEVAKAVPNNKLVDGQPRSTGTCAVCRTMLTPLNEYICKSCGAKLCLKHRYPEAHNCGKETGRDSKTPGKRRIVDGEIQRRSQRKTTQKKKEAHCACCTIF